MRHRTFHYVVYDRIPDWLACGWIAVLPATLMHHHAYGIVMEWLCDCKLPRPQ